MAELSMNFTLALLPRYAQHESCALQSSNREVFCLGAAGAVLMLLLGFVFPAGESEAEVQADLHPGRPAQHRGGRSGSVSPGRAVGESMTLGHCQRL